jgi:hypothetical protein
MGTIKTIEFSIFEFCHISASISDYTSHFCSSSLMVRNSNAMAFQSLCLKFAKALVAVSLVAVFKGTCSATRSACYNYTRQPHGIAVWLPAQISNKSMHRCPAESVQSQSNRKQPRF